MTSEAEYENQAAPADQSEAEYSTHIYQGLDEFKTVYHDIQHQQPGDTEDAYEDMVSAEKTIKQKDAAENNNEKRMLIVHFSVKVIQAFDIWHPTREVRNVHTDIVWRLCTSVNM